MFLGTYANLVLNLQSNPNQTSTGNLQLFDHVNSFFATNNSLHATGSVVLSSVWDYSWTSRVLLWKRNQQEPIVRYLIRTYATSSDKRRRCSSTTTKNHSPVFGTVFAFDDLVDFASRDAFMQKNHSRAVWGWCIETFLPLVKLRSCRSSKTLEVPKLQISNPFLDQEQWV